MVSLTCEFGPGDPDPGADVSEGGRLVHHVPGLLPVARGGRVEQRHRLRVELLSLVHRWRLSVGKGKDDLIEAKYISLYYIGLETTRWCPNFPKEY